MSDDQDPNAEPSSSVAQFHYAIRSARAVVEALILRDRDAAEAAALRTCWDCDLLIRLIRELTHLLLETHDIQRGFDPVATAALLRRADHVLSHVDASPRLNGSSATSNQCWDDESGQPSQQPKSGAAPPLHKVEPKSRLRAERGQTVASLGVRVRLVPYESDGHTRSQVGGEPGNSSWLASDEEPPRLDEC